MLLRKYSVNSSQINIIAFKLFSWMTASIQAVRWSASSCSICKWRSSATFVIFDISSIRLSPVKLLRFAITASASAPPNIGRYGPVSRLLKKSLFRESLIHWTTESFNAASVVSIPFSFNACWILSWMAKTRLSSPWILEEPYRWTVKIFCSPVLSCWNWLYKSLLSWSGYLSK